MVFNLKTGAVSLNIDYLTATVTCEGEGGVWRMRLEPFIILDDSSRVAFGRPSATWAREAGTSFDVFARYEAIGGSNINACTRIALKKISGEAVFEIYIEGDKPGQIGYLAYPSAWRGESQDGYTVLPRRQGELVPFSSKLSVDKGKIFERSAYMPMFGQVSGENAYLAVFDTPCDASYDFGSGEVSPLWRTSLGQISYQRRMIYRFFKGDYNDIAKAYRIYVNERGALVTLREKAARNPLVDKLRGCPVIHTGITRHVSSHSRYYRPDDPEYNDSTVTFDERARQIRLLRQRGLERAYTHFDGWCFRGYDNLHPLPLPPSPKAGGAEGMLRLKQAVRECGYLFGIHDQYRDYYYDSPFFTFDEARMNLNGSHSHNHTWHGGHYAYLCPEKALEYVKYNYITLEKAGLKPDSSYLDVFSLAELDECFNPRHRISREMSVAYRRECLDFLSARGIIPSSEETLDCILPSQVLCHHAPFVKEEIAEASSALPIPLFNLVYHDCVVIPWIGLKGENGDSGLPAPMSTYLYAILNANPVYCPIDASETVIADVRNACAVSAELMYTELTRHEFLTKDALRQRALYADGTAVEVDMERGTYSVTKA